MAWGHEHGMAGQLLGVAAGMASNFLMSKHFVFESVR